MKEMRMVRKGLLGAFLIVPIAIFLFTSIASASEWAKMYGGSGFDFGYYTQQTADEGYIVAGQTNSFAEGSYNAWILKLNDSGNVQWQKIYGGNDEDNVRSIQQTSDGGYIVAGYTDCFGAGGYDLWVLKLNPDGTVAWQKTYGGADHDVATSIQQTSDGGYIMAGYTSSFRAGATDTWVLKLNSNGTIAWQKVYGSADPVYAAYSIQQTSDGGYIMAGETSSSFGAGALDAWVLKLNSNGTIAWQKVYGGADQDSATSIQQTSDGGYIVAGYTDCFGAGGYDLWVLKLNPDGTVAWQKTYGGTSNDYAHSVQQTSDGGYIMAGGTSSFGAGLSDAWFLRLNSDGTTAWQKTYGGTWDDFAGSIQQTSDGGYVAAGFYNVSFSATYWEFFVLKLDINGDIPDCPIIGTSNATVNDTNATINDTTVTEIDTNVPPQTSTATPANTNATVTEICYSGPQNVTLLSPNGGEIIPSGSTYSIQWSAPPEAVKFTLRYSLNNGSTWKLIAKNITGISYDWTVPIPNNNKKNGLVKVIGFNAGGTKVGEDISDSTFTIEVIKVISPDGGETLTSGSTHTITWRTNATIRPVAQARLSYSRNGGTSWTAIKTLTGNPGNYNWTVPNVTSSTCKVKVVLRDSGGVTVGSDISDAFFTIQP